MDDNPVEDVVYLFVTIIICSGTGTHTQPTVSAKHAVKSSATTAKVAQYQNLNYSSNFSPPTQNSDILHPDDRICYVCYKSHLVTVKHIKNLVVSIDTDLKSLILEIKQSTPMLSEIKTWENAINYTVHSLAITVGKALLKQTAILLPQIYSTFKLELESIARNCRVHTEDHDLPRHVWLRSSLSSLL